MLKNIYLFANWKMYLDVQESESLAKNLATNIGNTKDNIKVAVFPNALSFLKVKQALEETNLGIGSQNSYWLDKGGFTGEVSMVMYKNIGSNYSLIGHSERRYIFNESNHDVKEKLASSLNNKLTPVICVGETEEERKNNQAEEIIEIQLRSAFEGISLSEDQEIFIAYEPIWAIGTGNACHPEDAEKMHQKISEIVKILVPKAKINILYGGSVSEKNIQDYLTKNYIDGVLVGNASTKLESFIAMYQSLLEKTA